MQNNTITVDYQRRRTKLGLYLLVIAYVALLLFWGFPVFNDYLKQAHDPALALKWLKVVIIFVLTPFVVISVAGFGIGRQTLTSGQYPPPGTIVLRNTEVITGVKTKYIAILLFLQFFIVTTLVLYCGVYIPNLLEASLQAIPPRYSF